MARPMRTKIPDAPKPGWPAGQNFTCLARICKSKKRAELKKPTPDSETAETAESAMRVLQPRGDGPRAHGCVEPWIYSS